MKKAKSCLVLFAATLIGGAPIASLRADIQADLIAVRQNIHEKVKNPYGNVEMFEVNTTPQYEIDDSPRGARVDTDQGIQPDFGQVWDHGGEIEVNKRPELQGIRPEFPEGIVIPGNSIWPEEIPEENTGGLDIEEEEIILAALPEVNEDTEFGNANNGPGAGFSGGACSIQSFTGASSSSALILGFIMALPMLRRSRLG